MVPPISSTRFLVMAMPRPVPCILFTVDFSSLSKGVNSFLINSRLIPMPVSRTRRVISTRFSCPRSAISRYSSTSPPAGVNLMALDRRLIQICFQRTPSTKIRSWSMEPISRRKCSLPASAWGLATIRIS